MCCPSVEQSGVRMIMNEPPSYLGPLKREDLVGHWLVEISETFESAEVCNLVCTFYRLDSGVVFTLPGPWVDEIVAEEPPADATPIKPSSLESVLGQEIVEIYRAAPEANLPDDSPYLALQNGYILTDVMGLPKGIPGMGLWVYPPGEIDMADLLPFWGRR